MIRIGIRKNLFYPLMLLLFIFLCRVDEIIMKTYFDYKIDYIFSAFIFIPQPFGALILILSDYKKDKKEKNNTVQGKKSIEYIENRHSDIEPPDSQIKIIFLILFDSFFNFITIIIGKHYSKFESKTRIIDEFIEKRLRSMHILFSAILCYLTINIKIYRHQKFSLTVISIFLIAIIIFESIWIKTEIFVLILFAVCFLIRSFLDTVEKYLFDVDYINPHKILLWEGILGNIFFIILSALDREPLSEIKQLISEVKTIKYFILIALLALYLVFSGFRSLYRIHTVQYFSPMARALFELILDPVIVGYKLWAKKHDIQKEIKHFDIYFILIVAILAIMSFFSLVYNDFIVLYCCNLEKDTYREIKMRAISFNIDFGLADENEIGLLDNSEVSSELSSKKRSNS